MTTDPLITAALAKVERLRRIEEARTERRELERRACEDAARAGMVICGLCGKKTPPARCVECGLDPAQQVESCPECSEQEVPYAEGRYCDTCAGERVVETPYGHLYELSARLLAEVA